MARLIRARRLCIFFVIFDLFVAFVLTASAQGPPAPPPRRPSGPRFDVSIGAGFSSGSGLGSADADLRGRSGGPFQLFAISSRIGGSLPVEGRIGFLLSPRYTIEMRGAWSRPELQASIAGDVEGAPALTVSEKVNLYSLDLGLLVTFTRSQPRTIVPFISGGAGYVATVHEGLTLLENGVAFRGGGGVKYPLAVRTNARIKRIGLRADAALVVTTGGLASGSGVTRQVATSGSLYLTF